MKTLLLLAALVAFGSVAGGREASANAAMVDAANTANVGLQQQCGQGAL